MDNLSQVLDHLEGKWVGEGLATYPTIDTFTYRETLIFERRDETSLSYNQRTEKRPPNQTTFKISHWENGFIRILPTGGLELVNAQIGGRSELLLGSADIGDPIIKLEFVSRTIANDERMIASARTFEIEDEILRYEMTMHTTKVEKLTMHLSATLIRSR